MNPGPAVRDAARQLIGDVEPIRLGTAIEAHLETASMVPGAVTVITAERLGGIDAGETTLDRAVGVQLCYEGLRLTRMLIREEERFEAEDPTEDHLDLVAAEVLVSRGFVELADTQVAADAIEIVRRFSRQQTESYGSDRRDAALEYDVVSLAVIAGATVVLDAVPAAVEELGQRLAADVARDPLPPMTAVTVPIQVAVEATADLVTLDD